MTSTRKFPWALTAGRRIATAIGYNINEAEIFARKIAPKINDIATAIVAAEPRRGPREIALYMLRHVIGRHADDIPALVLDQDAATAAAYLLHWSEEGPTLAAHNPRPQRTPPTPLRVTVFREDGRRTAWERVPFVADDPAHNRGQR